MRTGVLKGKEWNESVSVNENVDVMVKCVYHVYVAKVVSIWVTHNHILCILNYSLILCMVYPISWVPMFDLCVR